MALVLAVDVSESVSSGRYTAAARRDCARLRVAAAGRGDRRRPRRDPGARRRMVRPGKDRDHGRLDAHRQSRQRRRLCRPGAGDKAQFERADRDRAGAAGRRRRLRLHAGGSLAQGHRHFRRRHGQFRRAARRGARQARRPRHHDQRAGDPVRGTVARRVLPQERDRRAGRRSSRSRRISTASPRRSCASWCRRSRACPTGPCDRGRDDPDGIRHFPRVLVHRRGLDAGGLQQTRSRRSKPPRNGASTRSGSPKST